MSTALPTPCDRGTAEAREGRTTRNPGWTITATMLASSLAFIDGSVTNVALPALGKDLGGSAGDLSWTINAYLLPLAALLLLGGAAGDHYGRRRVLMLGILLFAFASVGCAVAPDLTVLLGCRALQGVGAALLMPNSLGILGSSFEGEARGRAVGTWASAGAIASAVGPPLGGWLVDAVGWRAIFFLNLPVAAAAIVIALRYVEESREGGGRLDWLGAVLATAALGALTWALTLWSSRHAMSPMVGIGLASGVVLLVVFALQERRLGERAMMPLALFASRPFVGLTAMTLLLYGALGGLLVLLPYLLIVGGGYSPTMAGLALLPFSIVIGTTSRLAGRMTARIGPRWPLTIGPIVTGIGFCAAGARRSAGELLDERAAGHGGDRAGHGGRGGAADNGGAVLCRPRAYGHRIGLQQRGCAHRWADRDGTGGRCDRAAWRRPDRQLPCRRDRRRGGGGGGRAVGVRDPGRQEGGDG